MSRPRPAGPAAAAGDFDALMAEVMAHTDRFGHRQHIHLTWLAVRRCGIDAATALISDGIRRTARYAGSPQKYHATMSRAWVELVGHHAAHSDDDTFDDFAEHHPALLDKRLLARYYRSSTLATAAAKSGWVEPDLTPLPRSTEADVARAAHQTASAGRVDLRTRS
ncbi:hypothetical protein [Krasilnikovia sp. MM14-A1259]|uniref:hypothetical protein n=1 Tax=Krasilnikovia sp. MM14-A1259 TaxID=3373539 RepID=UPI00381E1A3D